MYYIYYLLYGHNFGSEGKILERLTNNSVREIREKVIRFLMGTWLGHSQVLSWFSDWRL